jgi:hypothetical protein
MKRIESKESKEDRYNYYKNIKTKIETNTIFYRLII